MLRSKSIIKNVVVLFIATLLLFSCKKNSSKDKAKDLLSQMTLEEKVSLLGGYDDMTSNSIGRLGIPKLDMANGPHGVGGEEGATFFSSGISLAATWNPELVEKVGEAIGEEANYFDKEIMLGPCVNIHRLPIGGRNFESYSEDPYLASRMGVAWIKGVQSKDVAACVKHYAGNEQEFERNGVNVIMDERTFHEIHLPAFKAAVQEANTYTVMSAYNKFRGEFCSENKYLLTDVLRNELGFDGFVISDWDATHSTIPSAFAGLDMEMPGPPQYFGDSLIIAVKNGKLSEDVIDQKVLDILRVMLKLGVIDGTAKPKTDNFEAHKALSLKVSHESIVLLKNEKNLLPLNKNKIKTIAVIGPMAEAASLGGGGSSEVLASDSISILEGLKNKLGNSVKINYINAIKFNTEFPSIGSKYLYTMEGNKMVHGLTGVYYNNVHLQGEPVFSRIDKDVNFDWGQGSPDERIVKDGFGVRWTGVLVPPKSGKYKLGVNSNDGSKLFLNGKLIVHNWGNHAAKMRSALVYLEKGKSYNIMIEYFETGGSASMKFQWEPQQKAKFDSKAIDIAKDADIVILSVGMTKIFECEGFDRENMDLPGAQNQLIKAVAEANPNTIVLITGGTPISMMSWINNVPAIVELFYPGQEEGFAVADILFGDVNPSGKLPDTFPKYYKDNPTYPFYPGKNSTLVYGEGIYVGYRYYDTKSVEPLFPFGFGLSYTTFALSDMEMDKTKLNKDGELTVHVKVSNTGKRAGAEIVQLYIHDEESSVDREYKALKGFQRVELAPGEEKTVLFKIDRKDLAFYDMQSHGWKAEAGKFKILVGNSSKDIALTGEFELVD
ncbi:beta-glucosidase [hydrothermal vent metagenome]|uniref:Beta-glucosidase n=1 Tax=hydrothermal vent metagenome TaxID=652676 RepID=A0A3B1BUE6_9ZZZZ